MALGGEFGFHLLAQGRGGALVARTLDGDGEVVGVAPGDLGQVRNRLGVVLELDQ